MPELLAARVLGSGAKIGLVGPRNQGLDCEGVALGRWGRLCLCQALRFEAVRSSIPPGGDVAEGPHRGFHMRDLCLIHALHLHFSILYNYMIHNFYNYVDSSPHRSDILGPVFLAFQFNPEAMQRTTSENGCRLQRRPSWRSGLRGGLWREPSRQLKEAPKRAAKHRMAISEVAELNKAEGSEAHVDDIKMTS